MSSTESVILSVPATTANLGPGFDCIGAALALYNRFKFSHLDADLPADRSLFVSVKGLEADRVSTDATNLVYKSFVKLYDYIGEAPPPLHLEIELGVPLARGLGSSATAIAGGLMGANYLAGLPLPQQEVIRLAIAMEKHPDNVVPALLGGCRLAAQDCRNGKNSLSPHWEICEIPWHPEVVPVVAIPDFELSTEKARNVLPQHYTRADAIFNTAHLGLLLRGLETGNGKWLRVAMGDRIHQPYRQALIPGYQTVYEAALDAGAYGLAISGAGPTLLALSPAGKADTVAIAMQETWQECGVLAQAKAVTLDPHGTRCVASNSLHPKPLS
ncbi:homoserine kinase [Phormidium sp. CCY1219]|uniref:homoserine kinase n=1 Tax=Phormidium sp. CCY1219 TaxID=2886104 RepID=UPI002D1F38A0|nr:homoserine kinase [Phormidium sp. CCY1219]MEB3826423.1 homoserine kinase [Phormidium sp. CCY1219]